MAIGMTEWLIIAAVIVLLFGRGKVSELMGDIGRGITSFRRGLAEPVERPALAGQAPVSPARVARWQPDWVSAGRRCSPS